MYLYQKRKIVTDIEKVIQSVRNFITPKMMLLSKFVYQQKYTVMSEQDFKECIEACRKCSAACDHCAVSCLNEEQLEHLKRCIQLNLESSSICRSTAALMELGSVYSGQLAMVCAAICADCAEECEKHAAMGMEHCRECADACKACAEACEQISEL